MVGFASTGSSRARSAAFGVAAFSMAAFGSTAAFAKEPIAPACRSAGGEIAQLRCSTALSKKATAAYDARRLAAEARGKAADARTADADARTAAAGARSMAADARTAAADTRSAAEDRRTVELKKTIATASAGKACYDSIRLEVAAAKQIAPLTPEQKAAYRNRAEQCDRI